MRSTFGKSLGVAVEGIMPEVYRNRSKADPANQSGSPWPDDPAGPPEQTRYETRITGTGATLTGSLDLPEGHLWTARLRALGTRTISASGPFDRTIYGSLLVSLSDPYGDLVRDHRYLSNVNAIGTPPGDIGAGCEGTFITEVRGSVSVIANFDPVGGDPNITYTPVGSTNWSGWIGDTDEGALLVATWVRALLPSDEL